MAESILRRTWAEIDLDALEHNYRAARRRIGPNVKYLGVVKADAYGHGAVPIARKLEALGADYLAVSNWDEAHELRLAEVTLPILILGHTPPELVPQLLREGITQSVSDLETAKEYSRRTQACGGTLTIHVKTDTGMSRLGFQVRGDLLKESLPDMVETCRLPGLRAEGIFTHFAVADADGNESEAYTRSQFEAFTTAIDALEAEGLRFAIRHCTNSGALARYPETYLDMVRPGIALYGSGDDREQLNLWPVMRLKSTVYTVKDYQAETDISYGRTYRTERPTRMGVVPIGYGDGLPRRLSNQLELVTAQGPAPQRGRICMDMCMVDLTDLPGVQPGDEVEIFGTRQSVDELAAQLDMIPYELMCGLAKRVPRLYLEQGQVVEQHSGLF